MHAFRSASTASACYRLCGNITFPVGHPSCLLLLDYVITMASPEAALRTLHIVTACIKSFFNVRSVNTEKDVSSHAAHCTVLSVGRVSYPL
jgi:hypothetical protein